MPCNLNYRKFGNVCIGVSPRPDVSAKVGMIERRNDELDNEMSMRDEIVNERKNLRFVMSRDVG